MNYLYIVFIIFFSVFVIFYTISLFNNIFHGVPQVSTFNSDLGVLKKVFDKYLLKGKRIIDLGSGTGKMLRLFEKDYKMLAIGYEIDFSNYFISKIKNKLGKYKNKVFRKNYFNINLNDTDFIYVYLFPELMEKIEKKIWSSARKGTIIIVNAFPLKNHKAIEIFQKNGRGKVFVYKV